MKTGFAFPLRTATLDANDGWVDVVDR